MNSSGFESTLRADCLAPAGERQKGLEWP